ncbi:MAG: hypothetical protein F6K62_21295 [Sphaerospermopsis sp. SIO1G2]|nr:hypothetical protein [Sphaerospermopsis sp. SIO1G1]NET73374.1 hypothetical protein [Sphaerospermopsis sp. SIO1G2]
MLEKLFLASILTFSFGWFADIGWFENQQKLVETNVPEQIASTIFQNYEKTKTDVGSQQ